MRIWICEDLDMWRSGYVNVWICEGKDQLRYYMGLVTTKPVFRGLRTTKAQTSLRICAV